MFEGASKPRFASESATASPVEVCSNNLSTALDHLAMVVNRLEDRLVYVLATTASGCAPGDEQAVPCSPIEGLLDDATCRVQSQTARIDALIDRLRV